MGTDKHVIDKRYGDRYKDERKAAHAVLGTSMNRGDFDKLNEFLKENRITKVQLIYAGWIALQEQLKRDD